MNTAIILAAGEGKRSKENKMWADIYGRPLWTLSYDTFLNHPEIGRIVLVVAKKELGKFEAYLKKTGPQTSVCMGGKTRMESFLKGMDFYKNINKVSGVVTQKQDKKTNSDIIIDHNAANPLVTHAEISAVIKAAKHTGAAAVSHPSVDSILRIKNGQYVEKLDRKNIRLMQTPQAVRLDILQKIKIEECSDLSGALVNFCEVAIVDASPNNKKITFPEDIKNLRNRVAGSTVIPSSFIGEDTHEFSKPELYIKECLILGGLKVKSLPKLKANSDGDVILHAIGRALAAAKNESFSEHADTLCKAGIKDSKKYLEKFLQGITIQMLSISVECEKPKIDELPLTESLAKILQISEDKIRISAHSGEGTQNFGKGIRVTAILTII